MDAEQNGDVWGETVEVAGLRYACLPCEELAARLLSEEGTHWVVTPNALMLEGAAEEEGILRLLQTADLAVADGRGVAVAARREGKEPPPLLPGIELGEALIREAARCGRSVFFLGGREGVAERAAARMRKKYPTLRVAGSFWGYFTRRAEEHERLLLHLGAVRPDVLLVGLGFPLQEAWLREQLPRLPFIRVAVGVGGSLDVWSGRVRRVPRVLRRILPEGVWRMLFSPRRLRDLPRLLRFFVFRGGAKREEPLDTLR